MTDYKTWEEKIWLYLDGNLPQSEKELFLQSIRNNNHLRTLMEECEGLHTMLKEEKPAQPPASFVHNVMSRIEARSLVKANRPDWKKAGWLFLAGAFIILLISIYLVTTGPGSAGTQYPLITNVVSKLTEYSFFSNLAWLSSGIFLLMLLDHFLLSARKRQRSIKPV